jgi:anti-anti-sigma regulatory factor
MEHISELREQTLLLMQNEGDLDIDLTATECSHTAGIQILIAAMKSADRAGKKVNIAGMSGSVMEAASKAGLEEWPKSQE